MKRQPSAKKYQRRSRRLDVCLGAELEGRVDRLLAIVLWKYLDGGDDVAITLRDVIAFGSEHDGAHQLYTEEKDGTMRIGIRKIAPKKPEAVN